MKRFLKTLILSFLFLLGLAYTLLQSTPVQNFIITKITNILEDNIGTKVHIGHINIDFFHAIDLEDVLISDLHQDTIIYVGALKVDIKEINFSKSHLTMSFIELKEANIKLQRHKEDDRWAYLIFLDNFKSKNKKPNGDQKSWVVDISEIKLSNCTFQNKNEHARRIPDQFDEDYIRLDHIDGLIQDFKIDGDTSIMRIKELAAQEQCGFKFDALESLLTITPHEFNFNELKIQTPFSFITDQFELKFDSIEDFDDFLTKVKLEAHFDKSIISFDDLQYFASELRGMHQKITLSGTGKGPVDNLKFKNVTAQFGKSSYFKGNLAFKGLPDFYETFFDISTKDAVLNKEDLEYLLAQNLPDEILQLGRVNYQVKAIGFLRDFVLDGSFATAAGKISTDINFKFPQNAIESYSGKAFLNTFNLGKLTGNSALKELEGTLTVNGSGLSIKTVNTKIDADLKSLSFNNYKYQNIIANGTIANKLFKGKALINDENVNLDFDGTIDYSKTESIFDFNAKISNAKLKILNLDSSNSILNAQVNLKLRGSSVANIYGVASIPNITYNRDDKKYELKNLELASKLIGGKRSISITSDALDASIDGDYNFNELPNVINNEGNLLFPNYFEQTAKLAKEDFNFSLDLKKPEEFIALLNPKLTLKPTKVEGYFNSELHTYAIHVNADKISYDKLVFDSVEIDAERKPGFALAIKCKTKKIYSNQLLITTSSKIEAEGSLNNLIAKIEGADQTNGNKITIESNSNFLENEIAIQLNQSQGTFSNVDFDFTQSHPIFITKSGIQFNSFKIKSSLQEVVLDGKLSNNIEDQLKINIHDFELKTLNNLIKNMGVSLYGRLNGNFTVSNAFKNPYFATDSAGITIRNFQVDKDTFGNIRINSAYSKTDKFIYASLSFWDCDLEHVKAEGKIFPDRKTNYLDFNVTLDNTPVRTLNFIFSGLASNLEGTLTGKAKLTGSFDDPEFEGKAMLKNGSFMVDYLKTTYRLEDEIIIHKGSFEIKDAKLYDENKRAANTDVKVTHSNFAKWEIDIKIKNLSNFKILNTNSHDNDLFYGVGYATGDVTMSGDIDNIKMVMNLKSNKGTVINIPLSNPEYSSKSSYITFKQKTQKDYKKYQAVLSGLVLEMNLEVNEDAYIKLIFDSQLGDIIEGTGNGLINMFISATGDFSIFGYYEIVNGKYVFTKYDIFNKPFMVKSGGRITWDGDPYAAKMNLEAVYLVTQANANSLLQTTSSSSSNDVAYIPVNCILFLKGLLFKPDITFNLEIPKLQNFNNPQLENSVKTYIASWQQNPDELNRQVFSLLFFKRFFPLDNAATGIGINAGINTSVGDLITSQLTNLLGQVFTNMPIGIDYNKTDTKPAGIWIFKLSKKFFNDRLVLEGNYIYDQTQSSNVTGNISAQVLIDPNGQLRFTIFSKRANNKFTDNQNVLTNGVGFYWRSEFNSFRRRKKVSPLIDSTQLPL